MMLSVVVPARNEASRLEATCDALVATLGDNDRTDFLFVVDSTSDDETVAVGRTLELKYPCVRVKVVGSRGKGFAIASGVREARGDVVFLADADLAVDPSQFGAMIALAADGALAIASRSLSGSRRVGEPLGRFITGRLFNLVVRLLMVPGIRDTQCGFKAFRREPFVPVFASLESEGWCFDVEVIAQARRLSIPVVEVPVVWRYGHGSKVKPAGDAPQIARELLRLRRRYGRVP